MRSGVFSGAQSMSQHRKFRGYESQKIVADYMKENGFPHALSAGAGRQGSDVTGLPNGLDVEVKARRGLVIAEAMKQLSDRQGNGLGFAVLRMDGQGPASIENWPALIRFADLIALLNKAGLAK